MDEEEILTRKKGKKLNIGWILAVFFILVSGGLTYLIISMSNKFNNQISDIKEIQKEQFVRHTETNQFLLSTVDWSSRRAQLTLFMRDQVVAQWKKSGIKIDRDEAYRIAETNLRECDNYSYIDPFLILATQCIESKFIKTARSKMGARGLNQFMPATGRLLSGYFGIEYHDSLLNNIEVSTRFAVKLFDILFAQYQEWDVVLAGYNGGPWQAYYYKNKKENLALETKAYVPDVLDKKREYDTLFIKYRMEDKLKGNLAAREELNKLAYK